MKVAISTLGTFHSFDLAREMHARDALAGIFTGHPRFKLKNEGLPPHLIHSYPYLQGPYMRFGRRDLLGNRVIRAWEYAARVTLDAFTARRLPACDVFVGLSGSALKTGKVARQRGARYVCDRGSTHIRYQDRVLREEHDRWGLPFDGVDPRIIDREEAEYEDADCITVPSAFALDSFLREGVPRSRLRKLPYGVNLSRFKPTGAPDASRFDVLFVGGVNLRKGVPYLLQAYRLVQHPRKSLTFAGTVDRETVELLRKAGLWTSDAILLGHVPQHRLKDLMSRSHVLVLPSIEEGLALVQAQAMACGCVVIASGHTGATDLYDDGREGYIVPIRDPEAILKRMQDLADHPARREEMSRSALERVRSLRGWNTYGERAMDIYRGTAASVCSDVATRPDQSKEEVGI